MQRVAGTCCSERLVELDLSFCPLVQARCPNFVDPFYVHDVYSSLIPPMYLQSLRALSRISNSPSRAQPTPDPDARPPGVAPARALTASAAHNGARQDVGLRAIVRNCTALERLDLAWCEGLTPKGLAYLGQNGRHLAALNVSHTKLDDPSLLMLARCERLERLQVASRALRAPSRAPRVLPSRPSRASRAPRALLACFSHAGARPGGP